MTHVARPAPRRRAEATASLSRMTTCTTGLPAQRTTTTSAREQAVARYGPVHGDELVSDCFDAAVAAYRDARVTAFVPVLVERRLREVLQRG